MGQAVAVAMDKMTPALAIVEARRMPSPQSWAWPGPLPRLGGHGLSSFSGRPGFILESVVVLGYAHLLVVGFRRKPHTVQSF